MQRAFALLDGAVVSTQGVVAPAREWSFLTNHARVLLCVAHDPGIRLRDIANMLGITERTVKAHLTSVFQQLGVTDRTQAALWAREHLTDLD